MGSKRVDSVKISGVINSGGGHVPRLISLAVDWSTKVMRR